MWWILASLLFAGAMAQDRPLCADNEMFNGRECICAPGYFTSLNNSRARCNDECDNVYKSWFTTGECIEAFKSLKEEQRPACHLRCGLRIAVLAQIALIVILAAALSTLFFTIPMCIATCCSCIQAKRANKNAKRVYNDTQASKSQELSNVGNPYAYSYWPWYGRQ
ncbi:unnamed protein product, partial [Mesorhabditis belari]|uniref:Uncharacterized protein n=1 Tax=Mesorhabditis belari TaxID=2138241 RepID=A0AAF3ED58_9BILA